MKTITYYVLQFGPRSAIEYSRGKFFGMKVATNAILYCDDYDDYEVVRFDSELAAEKRVRLYPYSDLIVCKVTTTIEP